jgi:pimeloyl-ACP methyl ester carboxylesterase
MYPHDRQEAMSAMRAVTDLERPTSIAELGVGPIEYRLERRSDATVVVLQGGHMRSALALGEDVFADAGYTVLAPSRPGYGRTPLSTGTSVAEFTDVVSVLCEHLGVAKVAAVVGISGGGPTAVTMAARHPGLVERLILQSAVGWLPFPDPVTRVGARLVFGSATEHATWAAIHALMRIAPDAGLRLLLRGLTTRRVREVTADLGAEDRAMLIALFSRMRSGRGFINDLRRTPDVTAEVRQPALVIATRCDGGVPFDHALSLAGAIRSAELLESSADSHFIWTGSDWPDIADKILAFLATE